MTASIAERVAAGAAWLDENRPGWVEHIDLNKLDLSSECGCVLGQEFGDYFLSPKSARWDVDPDPEGSTWIAGRRGFDAESESGGTNDDYAALTAEWRRLITARRVLTS